MSGKILSRFACAALAATFVTTLDISYAEAQRRTLLEQWFPKAAKRWKRNRRQPDLELRQRQAAPVKKVSGPKYYTYKTETVTNLALASVLPVVAVTIPLEANALLGEDDPGVPSEGAIDVSSTGSVEPLPHVLRASALEDWSMKVEAGIAKALKNHYSKSPDYLWVDRDFQPNERARQVLAALKRADEFGLSPDDYSVEEISGGDVMQLGAEKAGARFELALSAAVLRYGADARDGRINPNGISGYHDFPSYKRNYELVAKTVFPAEDADVTLEGLHPDNSRFASLVAELAELRSQLTEDTIEPVKPGTFFKPGQENAELPKVVALIRKKASDELKTKHGQTFSTYDGRIVFDEPLVELVRDFQKESGLGADGIVGKNTLAKLSTVSPKAKIRKIGLAMERLRWLPENLGQRHVFINQPGYRATYVVNGKSNLSMRAIVGKPSNQTSFFYDTIELVEVNPYWNVPRSILNNEMLGKIRADPGYLAARNYEVVTARGVADPYSVDWYSEGGTKGVYIRQKPGARNALGELKILFPNKHAIYMHDTPSRGLFKRSKRALSHGCIRLQKPRDMAAAVLQTSVKQVSSYVNAGKNQSIAVKNKLPVYVSYFTAWPSDDGTVHYYTDIYGRDKALLKAMERTGELRNSISPAAS